MATMTFTTCPNCGAKNRIDENKAISAQPKCGRCGRELDAPAATSFSSSEPLVVTDSSFERDVLGVRGKPVLVDCWAPWCGPCRMLEPTIKQLAAESNGRYVVAKLNTDENQRTAAQYRIEGIPTMLLFKDGQLIDKLVGLQPKPTIDSRLAALV
ncbi:MAG TPA: thioredoxin [Tepidisphaeraceae bacterium]|nr:thioredoxin [Tepidisphaeraceae bacterium]